jgi:adenosylmethionine-8-amino-7-oxononanoate aminotransferase
MSVCDPVGGMHAQFHGYLPPQFSQPIPTSAADATRFSEFLAERRHELAGVIIEPLVQGAGGMKFHSAESLRMIAAACQKHDVLLIFDEIATGFGRTGSMFACEQAEVAPDIICLGKALTAGALGMAATIAVDRVFEAFLSAAPSHALMHGPTFMANPLACAAANASLDVFETEPRLAQVHAIERQMQDALEPCRRLSHVVDVRVKGAVGVVQVRQLHQLDRLRSLFVAHGVWLRPFADMIYLTPPLSISPAELTQLLDAVVACVREWSTWQVE